MEDLLHKLSVGISPQSRIGKPADGTVPSPWEQLALECSHR